MLSFRDAVQRASAPSPITALGLSEFFGMARPISVGQLLRDLEGVPTEIQLDASPITFDGGVPVGGFAHLTLRQDGTYTFSGHFHDSGGVGYNTGFAWVIVGPRKAAGPQFAYTIQHSGHVSGTFETGPRDDDWNLDGQNDDIKTNWLDLARRVNVVSQASTTVDAANLILGIIAVIGLILAVIPLMGKGSSGGGGSQAARSE